ncbi:MAG: DUF4163 domain-containing protein [Selenomonadaceae bacterium]|nr:DUF4163 domain-containing protein [Selenomonadaceae bacterium]MBQ7723134.1 DUF4163 domain-containing protein [Selenomonadaceae bacterium]
MRKIFIALLVALIVSVQNFCGAAKIESAKFNGNETLIYPVVHVDNPAVENRINAKIEEEISTFIKGLHYAAQYDNRNVLDARTSYEIGSNESGGTVILSIIITESQYFEGAAHPATWQHTLNFNTSSGELMGMNYLTEVGEGVSPDEFKSRIERKLREKAEREKLYFFPEALPLKHLPEDFYWDENLHVHFIFQHYDIAPYAAGIIDVDIDA